MRVKSIRLSHLRIPLLVPFTLSKHQANYSDSVLVVIETTNGALGFGECCPRRHITGENVTSVEKDLKLVQTKVLNHFFSNIGTIRQFVCSKLNIGNAAICGLELALLDAWSKETGNYLESAFKKKVPCVFDYTGLIPLDGSRISQYILKEFNFSKVKINIGKDLDENCQKIADLKDHYGADVTIRVDANSTWNLSDAQKQIPVLSQLGVQSFEQLFPKNKEGYYRQIMKTFGEEISIIADESVTNIAEAKYLIKNRLCNGFNLKISKLGGIFRTLQIYELAQKHSVSCQLGAHYGETSILTAAGLILATLAPNLTYMEGAFGTFLMEADICKRSLRINQEGILKLPLFGLGRGLGIDIEESLIEPYEQQLCVLELSKPTTAKPSIFLRLMAMQLSWVLR